MENRYTLTYQNKGSIRGLKIENQRKIAIIKVGIHSLHIFISYRLFAYTLYTIIFVAVYRSIKTQNTVRRYANRRPR